MSRAYGYSEFNEFNRFENLDGIETKIVNHLMESNSKHAQIFWRLLKYNDSAPLSNINGHHDLSYEEREELVFKGEGEMTSKRVFFQPFINDAWQEECSSVYVFVSDIYPFDQTRSNVSITIETVVHNKLCTITGDADYDDPNTNPNELDPNGEDFVVEYKNRATVLLKCVLAELNGLFLDGIGYLQFNAKDGLRGRVEMPMWINHSYYGHATTFTMALSGISDSSNVGF